MTYPDPNDSNPTTGNAVNAREAPIGKASNDGRDELSKAECKEQRRRRTLHEEEAVRASDENEGLRDDGDL